MESVWKFSRRYDRRARADSPTPAAGARPARPQADRSVASHRRCNLCRTQRLPERRIIERSFAWISRCRRNAKDYERKPELSEAMIHIAMKRSCLSDLQTANPG